MNVEIIPALVLLGLVWEIFDHPMWIISDLVVFR